VYVFVEPLYDMDRKRLADEGISKIRCHVQRLSIVDVDALPRNSKKFTEDITGIIDKNVLHLCDECLYGSCQLYGLIIFRW